MDRAKKLDILRRRIISEVFIKNWNEVWFYPEFDGVHSSEHVKIAN